MSKRPITAEDLLKIRFLGQVELSPDAGRLAYVVTTTDREKDGYRSAIHLLDLASGGSVQFTAGTAKDTQPRWSPDGRTIAFLSNRGGKNQIWLIDVDGGEARQLTRLAVGVGDHAWSPDSGFLTFTSRVKTGEAPAEEDPSKKDKDKDKDKDPAKSDVRVITRLHYKSNGVGLLGDERAHVFVVPASGGAARQLTLGECDDEHPSWSPDGAAIAFAANRTPDADYTNVRDIWTVSAVAGDPRQVTSAPGPSGLPIWSPDGRTIYYLGHDNSCRGATQPRVWAVPAAGGEARPLTDQDLAIGGSVTWDMTPGPAGSPYLVSGDHVYFSAAARGECHVFRAPLSGGPAEQLTTGPRRVTSFDVHGDGGLLAYAVATDTDPGEVAVTRRGGAEQKLTDLNRELLAELDLSPAEPYAFKGSGGWDCQGWIVKPPGFQPNRKYPAVLQIHGGPHSMYGHAFFHEFQLLAAQGWVVVFINPRGSQGYGQEFTNACRGDWGGKDYEDLMLGLDAAIGQGFIDAEHTGVAGGSYGGFMTSWVVSHTERFKAAVAMRALTDRYSFYGTSDIGPLFGESEFPGTPWDDHDLLFERSPMHYVKNVKTPLLILHSEADLRCPMGQGEELYVALKRMRHTVEFVRFPDETHELSRSGKPKHRLERLERIVGWFKKYL